jgi:hypothetical protein
LKPSAAQAPTVLFAAEYAVLPEFDLSFIYKSKD